MLSDEEYQTLNLMAAYTGRSRESVFRELIAGLEIKENPKADYPGIVRDLQRIGKSVNEIAITLHTHGFVDEPKLKSVTEELHRMEKSFTEIFGEERKVNR